MNIEQLQSFVTHLDMNGNVLLPQRFQFKVRRPAFTEGYLKKHGLTNWFHELSVGIRDDHISLSCTGVSLPGRSLSTNAVVAPGPEQKYPYQDVFEDLTVNFICTTGNRSATAGGHVSGIQERRFMDAWMASVCDPKTMIFNYSNDYAPDIQLLSYDNLGTTLGLYTFKRGYPIAIGAVEFSHDTEEVATFEVTFNYDRWMYGDDN